MKKRPARKEREERKRGREGYRQRGGQDEAKEEEKRNEEKVKDEEEAITKESIGKIKKAYIGAKEGDEKEANSKDFPKPQDGLKNWPFYEKAASWPR